MDGCYKNTLFLLQHVMNETSYSLHEALNGRFYLAPVDIVVPKEWSNADCGGAFDDLLHGRQQVCICTRNNSRPKTEKGQYFIAPQYPHDSRVESRKKTPRSKPNFLPSLSLSPRTF